MNQYIEAKQEEFDKVLEHYKKELSSIQTGRANPSILDGIFVEAYGSKSPLNTLANVNAADGNSIVVVPYDKNIIKEVEKAITQADLGGNVVNEGEKLRVSFPPLTEEKRKELVKKISQKMEDARISLRQVRDDIKNSIEDDFEAKEITEDDKFRFIKELDQEIADKNESLKQLKDKKEAEIMKV